MGGRLQYEQFGNNKLWFLYDADGLPAGLRYDDGTTATYYYYVCNWRGDVVSLYSDTSLVCKYDYDAWGNVTSVKMVAFGFGIQKCTAIQDGLFSFQEGVIVMLILTEDIENIFKTNIIQALYLQFLLVLL